MDGEGEYAQQNSTKFSDVCFPSRSYFDHSSLSSTSASFISRFLSEDSVGGGWFSSRAGLAAARAGLVGDRRGVYPDLARAPGGRGRPHPVLDLGGHRHERLLHVGRVLRGGLEEGDSQLIGVFLRDKRERDRFRKVPSPILITTNNTWSLCQPNSGKSTIVELLQMIDPALV